MRMFAWLSALLVAASVSAESTVNSRMVSTPTTSTNLPTTGILKDVFWWLDANWHTNIDRTASYAKTADYQAYVHSYHSTNTLYPTNYSGATYTTSNRTLTVDFSASPVIMALQAASTNGTPSLVQYLSLTNSRTTWESFEGSTNWVGVEPLYVTNWVLDSSSGSGLTFDYATGVATIPPSNVLLACFSGLLKDSYTNQATLLTKVTFRYASGSSDAGLGNMFEADCEDDGDAKDLVRGSDTRMFSAAATPYTLRIQARHQHDWAIPATGTKDKAARWQLILIKVTL